MSPEIIAIIAMGFLIIGAQTTMFIYLLQRMDRLEARMTAFEVGQKSLEAELKSEMSNLRVEMVERMTELEVGLTGRMTELESNLNGRMTNLEVSLTDRVARLEGVVLARTESGNGTVGASGDD